MTGVLQTLLGMMIPKNDNSRTWFKGKTPGNPLKYWKQPWFPVDLLQNPSIELVKSRFCWVPPHDF